MKILPIILIFILFFNKSVKSQNWISENNKNGNYEISFPSNYETKTDSSLYFFKKTSICVPKTDDNLLYSISYSENVNNLYHSDSLKNIDFDLDYTQKQIVKNDFLRLISVFPKSVLGYPGKEFRYKSMVEDKYVRIQVYIVKNRVYELKVETNELNNFNKSINYFFNSFRLTGYPENSPRYLNFPTESELQNKPYLANFNGETEQRIQVFETIFGKACGIMDMKSISENDTSGLLAIGVMYAKIPKNGRVTSEEFLKIVDNLVDGVRKIYNEGKVISKEKSKICGYNGIKFKLTYKLGNKIINETKLVVIDKNNILYHIMAMSYLDTKEELNFIKSFKIKN